MAQMCAKLIRRRGHSAVIARSSEDALALIRGGARVDVVISDVQMPHMTGIELLAGIRQLDPELPIILMTGYATMISPGQANTLGATDYLTKPFDAEAFIGSLERAIRKRERTAILP